VYGCRRWNQCVDLTGSLFPGDRPSQLLLSFALCTGIATDVVVFNAQTQVKKQIDVVRRHVRTGLDSKSNSIWTTYEDCLSKIVFYLRSNSKIDNRENGGAMRRCPE
jgi:hypothetical protein